MLNLFKLIVLDVCIAIDDPGNKISVFPYLYIIKHQHTHIFND